MLAPQDGTQTLRDKSSHTLNKTNEIEKWLNTISCLAWSRLKAEQLNNMIGLNHPPPHKLFKGSHAQFEAKI